MKYVVMKYQKADPGKQVAASLSMTQNPNQTIRQLTETAKHNGSRILEFQILDDHIHAEALYEAINQF